MNRLDLTIVMYHYVRPIAESAYPRIKGLELDLFRAQLEYMRRHYNPVSVEELLASGREEAAEFLEQAAGFMPQARLPALMHAAALLRSEARLLTERFPSLDVAGSESMEELRGRYSAAAAVVSEMAELEAAVVEVVGMVTEADSE